MGLNGKLIAADEWADVVLPLLGLDPDVIQRVIIDAERGQALKIYVEGYGQRRLLTIVPPTGTAIVITVEEDEDGD